MCDKCKMMGSVGNCENQKADMFRRPCPAIHGADINDCPYSITNCKICDQECKEKGDFND